MLARIRKAMEQREEGFTLIELLVVIIIIGILAAIAIPVFLSQRQKGYDAQAKSDLHNLATSEESYLTDNPTTYTATVSDLTATAVGFKQTTGVKLGIAIDGANGYCAAALSQSGKYYWWDSEDGGLLADTTTVLTAAPASDTTGLCASSVPAAVS